MATPEPDDGEINAVSEISAVPYFKQRFARLTAQILFGVDPCVDAGIDLLTFDRANTELERWQCRNHRDQTMVSDSVRQAARLQRQTATRLLENCRRQRPGSPFTSEWVDALLRTWLNAFQGPAMSAAWCTHLVLRHRPFDRPGTPLHSSDLESWRAVVGETLRLYPPAWLLQRTTLQTTRLADTAIATGATVSICSFLTHRHEACWPRPDDFLPQRFLGKAAPRPGSFIPFGAGVRLCPASHMAVDLVAWTLRWLFETYRVAPLDSEPRKPIGRVSLWPDSPIRLRLSLKA